MKRPIKIKPLEWQEYRDPAFAGGVAAEAQTLIGMYQAWGTGLWMGKFSSNHMHDGNLETAKAGAQADYEHRIKERLE